MKIFNCNEIKFSEDDNELYIIVGRIKLVYKISVTPGIIEEYILKSTNYKSLCKIVVDTRKGKIIHIDCVGVENDRVKDIISQCFKEQGLLYIINK